MKEEIIQTQDNVIIENQKEGPTSDTQVKKKPLI